MVMKKFTVTQPIFYLLHKVKVEIFEKKVSNNGISKKMWRSRDLSQDKNSFY